MKRQNSNASDGSGKRRGSTDSMSNSKLAQLIAELIENLKLLFGLANSIELEKAARRLEEFQNQLEGLKNTVSQKELNDDDLKDLTRIIDAFQEDLKAYQYEVSRDKIIVNGEVLGNFSNEKIDRYFELVKDIDVRKNDLKVLNENINFKIETNKGEKKKIKIFYNEKIFNIKPLQNNNKFSAAQLKLKKNIEKKRDEKIAKINQLELKLELKNNCAIRDRRNILNAKERELDKIYSSMNLFEQNIIDLDLPKQERRKFSLKNIVDDSISKINKGCKKLIGEIDNKLNPALEVSEIENKTSVYSIENYKESFNKLSEAEQKNFIEYIELQDRISVLKKDLRKQEEILGDNNENDINHYSQLTAARNLTNEINGELEVLRSESDSLYEKFDDAQKDLVKCYYSIKRGNPNAFVEYLNDNGLHKEQKERLHSGNSGIEVC